MRSTLSTLGLLAGGRVVLFTMVLSGAQLLKVNGQLYASIRVLSPEQEACGVDGEGLKVHKRSRILRGEKLGDK